MVSQLSRLPGIGERTATRLVHHLLRQDRALLRALAESLVDVADHVHECPRCCTLTANDGPCSVCQDTRRDDAILCVVSSIQDQAAIEATSEFRGRYHVLHGTLSPIDGTRPEDLRLQPLLARLLDDDKAVAEVILATPPSVDGEATALYLKKLLGPHGLKLTRIASGVPVGGDLQFADKPTLARAIALRRAI
ncbi:MAG: recombination mediator RecR [Deltaproteobacteria bacterium]|nr:recombination mediator RecR [Deltaproteobacteria bacterium]